MEVLVAKPALRSHLDCLPSSILVQGRLFHAPLREDSLEWPAFCVGAFTLIIALPTKSALFTSDNWGNGTVSRYPAAILGKSGAEVWIFTAK
jgi:hypothetical protein